ncbi:unnamed protein product [Rotaria magnacalcarata]|uniref:Major facilitator superfamily (MFS) profile domain-containing protein n=4 Tax=Rotaria magnacalcarata TaxID=392030 RepID=A0A814XBS3_9BILA|nr:unnamed protein product [Rotaria magnacalcarata]CAF1407235.1 unnamed protein product [Rotaria magnacalcarata]CAF3850853.1 unnamed protein product [Rotaria magnacalcarata]
MAMKNNIESNVAATERKSPDGGWGWVIVFSSFMIHFIMDGITYSMGDIYLHPMMEVLGCNRGTVSFIFGMLPAITLGSGLFATILINRHGCRKMTIIGSCLAAMGFLASSLFANIWFYYFAIGIVAGFGFGLIYLAAIVSINFYFDKKISRALGIAVCGSGLGTMAFPWIMPYIINYPMWFDVYGGLLNESAIIFMCVIFGMLMIPLPKEPSEKRRLENKVKTEAKRQAKKSIKNANIMVDTNEQHLKLLPNQESIPSTEISELHLVDSNKQQQQPSTDHVFFPDYKQNKLANEYDKVNYHQTIVSDSIDDEPLKMATKDLELLENDDATNEDDLHTSFVQVNASNEEKTTTSSKQSFFHELSNEIDIKLLKNHAFVLFIISNFLTSLGFNIPYNFANDLAIDAKVAEHRRHWIIMSIGFGNCIGRIIIGVLGDFKWINRLNLYNIALIFAGIATMTAPLCGSIVYSHMAYAFVFGFFSGGYVGLTTVIVKDLVGENKVSHALGITYSFQGLATAIGTPIVGTMRDYPLNPLQPYLWPYIIFGGSIILSGIILFAIPKLKRRQESSKKTYQDSNEYES